MDADTLIAEIKRTAAENGGAALGERRFKEVTGIQRSVWCGKHWRNWSEAVRAAGLTENQPSVAHERSTLMRDLVVLTRKNRRFPTIADLGLERQANPAFPSYDAFQRLGSIAVRIETVRQYAINNADCADVLEFLPPADEGSDTGVVDLRDGVTDGFVYMVKSGEHYKIGKTFAVPRRHRQIALELPEKLTAIHSIRTDDPSGIEAYWHNRFESKCTNGEWFKLSREDVQAFKKRKHFM